MVWRATYDDLPALVEYVRQFHGASPWACFPSSPGAIKAGLQKMLGDPRSEIFMHSSGALGATISDVPFGVAKIAHERFWHATSRGLHLLAAFERWAFEEEGVDGVSLSSLANDQSARLDKVYIRRGYEPIEHHYFKRAK